MTTQLYAELESKLERLAKNEINSLSLEFVLSTSGFDDTRGRRGEQRDRKVNYYLAKGQIFREKWNLSALWIPISLFVFVEFDQRYSEFVKLANSQSKHISPVKSRELIEIRRVNGKMKPLSGPYEQLF